MDMYKVFKFIIIMIFIFSLSPSLMAKEKCEDVQNIFGLEDVIHTSLLSQPPCKKLKEIWDQRVKLSIRAPRNFDNKFSRAFTDCQAGLYKNCYQQQKDIAEEDLHKVFQEFKKDPYLKMEDPARMCLQRAYILAEKLSKAGYKVEIAGFLSPTLVGLVKNEKNEIVGFNQYSPLLERGYHYAVSVDVKLANGKIEKRILDPQYAEEPMSVDVYSRHLTGDKCYKKSRPEGCQIEFNTPVVFNYQKYKPDNFLKGKLLLLNQCGWNMLDSAKEDIDFIRSKNFLAKPLKATQTDLGEEEMKRLLHIKNLEEKIELYQSTIYEIEDALDSKTQILNSESRKTAERAIKKARKKILELKYELSIRDTQEK